MPAESFTADLHCHTQYSDGSCTVAEVLALAKARGLSAIAVTDHDTFAGVAEAVALGESLGIRVIPGLEISSRDPKTGRKVHILGYLCRDPEPVERLCRRTLRSRNAGSVRSAQVIAELYHLPLSFLLARRGRSTCLYKQHLMQALMDAGVTNEMFGEVFRYLFTSNGGVAFSKTEYPDVEEAIDAVHEAGGLAVLAHPNAYHSEDLLADLVRRKKLDGVEVYHPRNLPESVPQFEVLCRENGLLMTGGSDFHGSFGRTVSLGTCCAPEESLQRLSNQQRFE